MRRLFITFIILTTTVFALVGCGGGGSSGSGGDSTGTATTIADAAVNIGMDKCLSCHIDNIGDQGRAVDGKFTDAYRKWLVGPHGNFEYKVQADDATANEIATGYYSSSRGGRYYFTYNHYQKELNDGDAIAYAKYKGYPILADTDDECKVCHGPSELDNQGVAELPIIANIINVFEQNKRGIAPDWENVLNTQDAGTYPAANDKTLDWANADQKERLVIGCESCHGGANMHQVDPTLLPAVKPDAAACATCHGPDHHHSGGDIYTDYAASPHAVSLSGNTHISADDDGLISNARCAKCHTDEGGRKYKDIDADTYATLKTSFENLTKMTYADLTDISCRTCHDAHNPHAYLEDPTAVAGVITRSAQFNTCTNCHQYLDAAGALNEPYHQPVTTNHPSANTYGAWNEIIKDTHFDLTVKTTAETIQGYVIDPSATDACSRCHNPHGTNEINEQWAKSAHGGHIATVKATALAADETIDLETVDVTETDAAAWTHYDFKDAGRQTCQRCHTSTGFGNFADDPATYDQTANTFVATGDQRELLYCDGCHSDNTGTLRDPGAPTASLVTTATGGANLYDTTADTDANRTAQQLINDRIEAVGDLGNSNTCIPCHSGRFTVATIVENDYIDDNSLDGDSEGSGTHYKDTAGTLFRYSAYEMPGLDYENKSYFAHATIGTVDADGNEVHEGTGTAGPCATCHMSSDKGHEFSVLDSENEFGVSPTCRVCHDGSHGDLTADVLTEEKEGFENAITAMKYFIENNYAGAGLTMLDSYPYIGYGGANAFDTSDDLWTTDFGANDRNAYGVAYNYVYIHHEGGAYAHNRYYAKRIIFDAIDLMDNGVLDGTIDLTGYAAAATWYGGTITAIERP